MVASPVRAGNAHKFKCLQSLCVCYMRTYAHVDIVALLIKAYNCVFGEVAYMLHLVVLASVAHKLYSLVARKNERFNRKILLADFLHLGFNSLQRFLREFFAAQVYVIVKPLFICRAVSKFCLRIKPLHGLCHNVRRRVSQYVKFLLFCTFFNFSVRINNFHIRSPFSIS